MSAVTDVGADVPISADAPADPVVATYEAGDIQVLAGLDAVRRRPGMYIGDNSSAGLSQLLWEVLDNAADEAAAGHGKEIEVVLGGKLAGKQIKRDVNWYTVIDRGRGIPVGEHADGITALEVVFTQLHAGAKFGGGQYQSSGGLHGVGAAVVNAYSEEMIIEVDRNRRTHRLEFHDRVAGTKTKSGKFTEKHDLAKVANITKTRTGTRVSFKPELKLFEPGATISFDEVRDRAEQLTFLIPKLKITVTDRRGTKLRQEQLVSHRGLADYVASLCGDEAMTKVITISGDAELTQQVATNNGTEETTRPVVVEAALTWRPAGSPRVMSFVNTIPTPDGGTHVEGFEQAVTRAVAAALRDASLRKLRALGDDARALREDVRAGLVGVVRVSFAEPQFRGQAKRELTTPQVRSIVSAIVRPALTAWLDGKAPGSAKTHVRSLLDHVAAQVVGRAAMRRSVDEQRATAKLGNAGLPAKLADCRQHPEGELLIVEGDSAAGPAKRARDATWQAVLPLRGKVVNSAKSTNRAVLDNAEAHALFTAIGAGSGDAFELERARYERVVLLADADVDGSHIRCLVLTLAHTHMRDLLRAGRVYAAQPPTHAVTVGQTKRFVYSEDQLERLLAEHEAAGKHPRVTRFKGLGEMDDDELRETTLDPRTRVLRQITLDDAKKAAQTAQQAFETMMGPAVEPRRDFITAHSAAYGHTLDV